MGYEMDLLRGKIRNALKIIHSIKLCYTDTQKHEDSIHTDMHTEAPTYTVTERIRMRKRVQNVDMRLSKYCTYLC